ncbi:PaaI family thioesterase [Sphingomonas sp. 8AM]|uniref:PaaI family thioesterase n=1 Tax=Sphingomonas sp. 8AM TaxID=2653170 RepID=UPI0012F18220|nr:PaaI family thioesterase [Sphingomonas sp. 8AM]VXC49413.1 Phenylacetic acid degradation protein [Sphingomonas sp. 8AM]
MDWNPIVMARYLLENPTLAGHGGRLGQRYHAHGADWIEVAQPWHDALVGDEDTGIIASGPIIALMDVATSLAVWHRCDAFVAHATLDLRIDYLRPARPHQTVIGRGECLRITRSIAFTRGIAHDGDPDDPVAHVAATFMATAGSYPRVAA